MIVYKPKIAGFVFAVLATMTGIPGTSSAADDIAARVESVLEGMTVEEKAGQMTQVTLAVLYDEDANDGTTLDEARLDEAFNRYHIGSVLNTGSRALSIEEWHRVLTRLQDAALATRSRIPVLYGIDAIHGATYTQGSTLFPHNIGLAAARSPALVADASRVTALEVRASGIRWNFDPVLDLGRNPLWSRFEETFGEDPWLAGELGSASIRAYEQDDLSDTTAVASCIKHFIGYSVPDNGKDRTPAYISDVQLHEQHLPPFAAAVDAGSATIMINSASINGMPVHGSRELLTDLLRGELGFEGVVVSDWEDVIRLHTRHRIAETPREAVRMAVEAGIDMSMVPRDFSFAEHLAALVHDGEVSEARIDESVRRILTLKFRLGLFDRPYPEAEAVAQFGKPAYRELALDAARQSMTLLENRDKLLPLGKDTRVLVAGPAAHNLGALHGSWSYTWQGTDESAYPDETLSIAKAFLEAGGAARVTTLGAAAYDDPANYDREALAAAADGADVILLALGEPAYAESPGALDDLDLDGRQQRLARAAFATGKPVVVVLVEGRPRVLGRLAKRAGAVLQAYRPGSRGAEAIADVVYGDYNPSGVLPYSYPQYSGDITHYDRRVLANVQQLTPGNVTYDGYKPQWPFGHGLSYTSFELSELEFDRQVLTGDGSLLVSLAVKNTGARAGTRVLDLFVSDLYASLSPATRKLRASQRVDLAAGESRRVTFEIDRDDLTFVNAQLDTVVEPGRFRVTVGEQSAEFDYRHASSN